MTTKRILAAVMALVMVFCFAACKGDGEGTGSSGGTTASGTTSGGTTSGGTVSKGPVKEGIIKPLKSTDPTNPATYTLDVMTSMDEWEVPASKYDKEAAALLKTIEANPDTLKPKSGGKAIYVSNDGNDTTATGAKDKPYATIKKAIGVAKSGDVIYLNRGDYWRETGIIVPSGVSIGAYGSGNKPTVLGSPQNYAEQKWTETETENVYRTLLSGASNVGAVVLNHGQGVGDMKTDVKALREEFDFYEDLSKGVLYMYMSQGNPADVCDDIAFCSGFNLLNIKSNTTVQNVRIMYTGRHGVSMTSDDNSSNDNVKFEGMVLGYIGGSKQNSSVRLGNAIEVWGQCNNYVIDKCHVYQCYDAGLTMQYESDSTKELHEENIKFTNNLLEYNYYSIEYFFTCNKNAKSSIRNVDVSGNVIRWSGYGWGEWSRSDRGNAAAVQGRDNAMRTENFVFKNNIFDLSYASKNKVSNLIRVTGVDSSELPTFVGNTYAQIPDELVVTSMSDKASIKADGAAGVLALLGDSSGKVVSY